MRYLAFALLGGCYAQSGPTLLTGCPISDGGYDYGDASCGPIVWDHTPLRLAWIANQAPGAVAAMNEDLGFTAFVVTDLASEDPVDVLVDFEGPAPPNAHAPSGGRAIHYESGGRLRAAVATWRNGTQGASELVLCHELGHVLGLAHDKDDPGSLMYPTIKGQPMQLREDDRELLRRLYADLE